MANLELLKNVISTKYGDMEGLASIDGHLPTTLLQLCTDHGIDLKNWFLVGLEFYDSEPIGQNAINVCALLLKKDREDEDFDELKDELPRMDNVEIHKKHFCLNYEELAPYIKRIHVGVLSNLSSYIKSAHFVEDDD